MPCLTLLCRISKSATAIVQDKTESQTSSGSSKEISTSKSPFSNSPNRNKSSEELGIDANESSVSYNYKVTTTSSTVSDKKITDTAKCITNIPMPSDLNLKEVPPAPALKTKFNSALSYDLKPRKASTFQG